MRPRIEHNLLHYFKFDTQFIPKTKKFFMFQRRGQNYYKSNNFVYATQSPFNSQMCTHQKFIKKILFFFFSSSFFWIDGSISFSLILFYANFSVFSLCLYLSKIEVFNNTRLCSPSLISFSLSFQIRCEIVVRKEKKT
jgi:hypothetical protein